MHRDISKLQTRVEEIYEMVEALVYAPGGPAFLQGKAAWDAKQEKQAKQARQEAKQAKQK